MTALAEQPEPPDALHRLTDAESARLDMGSPRQWRTPEKTCLTCNFQRTGHHGYRWYAEGSRDTASVVDYRCDCVTQYQLHRWMLHAGIGLNYQRLSWDDALDMGDDALNAALDYAVNADYHISCGNNMCLWSPDLGTGKTYLASMLAKRMLSGGSDVYFATFTGILDLYSSSWRSDEERALFNQRVLSAEVLFIDDLGREHPGRAGVAESMLDHVLRGRISACLPTVLTTNLTPDLFTSYGDNLVSLLSERMITVEVGGTDKRPMMSARVVQEHALQLTRPIVLA